jgi:hypothetical protein
VGKSPAFSFNSPVFRRNTGKLDPLEHINGKTRRIKQKPLAFSSETVQPLGDFS